MARRSHFLLLLLLLTAMDDMDGIDDRSSITKIRSGAGDIIGCIIIVVYFENNGI